MTPPTTIHVAFCRSCGKPLMVATTREGAAPGRCEEHPTSWTKVTRYQQREPKERTGRKPRRTR